MAKKNTSTNSEVKEFSLDAKNGNTFNGRIYQAKETKNATYYPLSLTINGLAIVGSKYFKTKDSSFISFPNYKGNDGEYHNICYFFNKEDIEDLNELADTIGKLL